MAESRGFSYVKEKDGDIFSYETLVNDGVQLSVVSEGLNVGSVVADRATGKVGGKDWPRLAEDRPDSPLG